MSFRVVNFWRYGCVIHIFHHVSSHAWHRLSHSRILYKGCAFVYFAVKLLLLCNTRSLLTKTRWNWRTRKDEARQNEDVPEEPKRFMTGSGKRIFFILGGTVSFWGTGPKCLASVFYVILCHLGWEKELLLRHHWVIFQQGR